MSLSSNHLNHMNIVDSRKAAVNFINEIKGLPVYHNGVKVSRVNLKSLITKGYIDGISYGVDYRKDENNNNIKVLAFSNFYDYHRKIGQ